MEAVRLLLEAGADPRVSTMMGNNALAREEGLEEIIHLLEVNTPADGG